MLFLALLLGIPVGGQDATSLNSGRVVWSKSHIEFRRLENNVVLWSRDEEFSQPPILLQKSDAVVIAFRRDEYHYIEVIDPDGAVRWGKRVSDYSAHAPTVAASDSAIIVLPGVLQRIRVPTEGVQSSDPAGKLAQWRKGRIVLSLKLETGTVIWSMPEPDVGYPLVLDGDVIWTYRLQNPIESYRGNKQIWFIEHRDYRTGELIQAWEFDGRLQNYAQFWRKSKHNDRWIVQSVGMVSSYATKEDSGALRYDSSVESMFFVHNGEERFLREVDNSKLSGVPPVVVQSGHPSPSCRSKSG